MKRAGFTMIELIFVIVILGILAAVAIPKLAATRNDATASTVATAASTCITEQGGIYMKKGIFGDHTDTTKQDGTNANIATSSASCLDAITTNPCFTMVGDKATGELVVTTVTAGSIDATSTCGKATYLLNKNGLVDLAAGGTKTHQF